MWIDATIFNKADFLYYLCAIVLDKLSQHSVGVVVHRRGGSEEGVLILYLEAALLPYLCPEYR